MKNKASTGAAGNSSAPLKPVNVIKALPKSLLLFLIRFYKRQISPLVPPSCRFTPTCSEYAYQAVEKYGFLKGGYLAVKRILRCNPFCKGGYDPVP